jgi:hypothetical protein
LTLDLYIPGCQLSGAERFSGCDRLSNLSVVDLWRWSMSELGSNAQRGIVAEFLVAAALGLRDTLRFNEWHAYDLCTADGLKVEVKCSGYLQVWPQKKLSRPNFGVGERTGWIAETNTYTPKARSADVYVLALHKHTDKGTFNVLDVEQWHFFVVATKALNPYDITKGKKHTSLGLAQLREIEHECCSFEGIASAIERARSAEVEFCKECMLSAPTPT